MRFAGRRAWYVSAFALVFGFFVSSAWADPPNRVARVSYLSGNVSFQPAGDDDQWAQVSLNRPLATGDKVYTDKDSRIELQIGAADIRLDAGSTLDLLNLDDTIAQMELTEGVVNLRVRHLEQGQTYEVDTPTLAFVVTQPGNYRVDIDPQGQGTMVTVFDGGGDVYGEENASYTVSIGHSYRFNDSALHDYETLDIPQPDDFDMWCQSRDAQYTRSVSSKYVPQDMIGYTDLDTYGSWATEPDYGNVWYPTTVDADWAPYRDGYWAWIDPWGWTWVDNAAWGFAPFHYGRWAYVGSRWGWVPGPVVSYGAVYSPAMVAFADGISVSVGVGGGPVGWFPLGPRDVYVPWYGASRAYFTSINRRNAIVVSDAYITTVYASYSAGRPITHDYAYRNNALAFTVVSRDVFVGARAVGGARVKVDVNMLRGVSVVSRVGITPTRASFVSAAAPRGAMPQSRAFNRGVIARTSPPQASMSINARMEAFQRNGGRPLSTQELRGAPPKAGAAANAGLVSHVQVVGQNARPRALPARGGPAAAGTQPAMGAGKSRGPGNAPTNVREGLPSSRFAPHSGVTNAGNAATSTRSERGTPRMQNRAPTNTPSTPSLSGQAASTERSTPRMQNRAPASMPSAPSLSGQAAPTERSTQRMQNRAPANATSAPPPPAQTPRNEQPASRFQPRNNANQPQMQSSGTGGTESPRTQRTQVVQPQQREQRANDREKKNGDRRN
jgi:hypothetical protein